MRSALGRLQGGGGRGASLPGRAPSESEEQPRPGNGGIETCERSEPTPRAGHECNLHFGTAKLLRERQRASSARLSRACERSELTICEQLDALRALRAEHPDAQLTLPASAKREPALRARSASFEVSHLNKSSWNCSYFGGMMLTWNGNSGCSMGFGGGIELS